MKLWQKLGTAREIVRSEGWRALSSHAAARLRSAFRRKHGDVAGGWERHKESVDAAFDSNLGVDTGGTTELHGLDVAGPHRRFSTAHIASDPGEFSRAMAALDIEYRDFTFIDLGSGKGRALILALSYPFRRILGVEFALPLHRAAEINVRRLADTGTDTSRIALVHADAAQFNFPPGPLVFFLYNPFRSVVMEKVAERVRQAHAQDPRPIFVVYCNPFFEKIWLNGGFSQLESGETYSLLAPRARGPADRD